MSAPVLNGPFIMPMFRSFVPRKMQPWIYLFIAVTFQLSSRIAFFGIAVPFHLSAPDTLPHR